MTLCPSGGDPPHSLHCHYSSFNTYMRRFRRFCSGSLALASLDLPAGIIVPTSPRRSPPRLLPQQLAVAWDQRPDRRTRRALLHLSYSTPPPFGPVMLVTQDPQRTLGGAGSDAGQCPIATRCEGGSGPHSNTLWAAFDNAESRLGGHERHVVGHYRLGQALEGERAKLFSCDTSLQRDVDALAEQNLAVLGLSAETGGNIAHCADRGVAGALGKTDLAQRRIALRDTGAKTQIATSLAPVCDQRTGRLAHRHRHLDRALGWVRDGHRIIEEHHDPVARELVERSFILADQWPQSAVVFAQKFEHFFRLGGLGERCVAE